YTQLNTGNYCVYELHRIDSGTTDLILSIDTCFDLGDSMINGNTYKVVVNFTPFSIPNTTCLRDSSGYLVNEGGIVYYKENLTNDTLSIINYPTIYDSYNIIYHSTDPVIVPAGTFSDVITVRNDV